MKIRSLRKKDIPEAVKMAHLNFPKKWAKYARSEFQTMFEKNGANFIVSEDKGKLVGLAGYIQAWMDWGIYEVFWVNVLPERQRQGIGQRMVSSILKTVRAKGAAAILLTSTDKNAKYYIKHFGFETAARFGKNRDHLMILKK